MRHHTLSSIFLFRNRNHAGNVLTASLERFVHTDAVLVGLAAGGVVPAAVAAAALELPLDAVVVRRVMHPARPGRALGAVAPAGIAAISESAGLTGDELLAAIACARADATALDVELHRRRAGISLAGRTALLVDDGIATGATMRAACRWAESRGARRIVAVAPVGERNTLLHLSFEVDEIVCPYPLDDVISVGLWYEDFGHVEDDTVAELLALASRGPLKGQALSRQASPSCSR